MSKSGPSLSVGIPGAHLTFGRRLRKTLGIPGTGIYYTDTVSYQSLSPGRVLLRGIIAFLVTLALIVAVAALGATVGTTASIFSEFM
jgi:hypothetical protein